MKRVRRLSLIGIIIGSMLASILLSAADSPPVPAGSDGSSALAAVNLLVNGDFETGDAEPWETYQDVSSGTMGTVTAMVYDDHNQYAYQITAPRFEWQYETKRIVQTVRVNPGEWITLSADLYIEQMNNALVTLRLEYLDAEGRYLEGKSNERNIYRALDNSNIGTPIRELLSAYTPADASYAKVHIILKAREADGSGVIQIDNLSLTSSWSPRLLHAVSATDTTIQLAWSPPVGSEAIARYHIAQDDTVIGAVYGDVTDFTVTNLRAAAQYRFTVSAETENGVMSDPSNNLVTVTAKSAGSTTIMPIGASMTYGKFYEGGYRGFLWQKLRQAGLDANLVGSRTDNPFGAVGDIAPDLDHEGHGDSGYTVDDLIALVDKQVPLYNPDILLVFTGTNDMFSAGRAAAAPDDVSELIDRIHELSPSTHIIISSITPMQSDPDVFTPRVLIFNAKIRALIVEHQSRGQKVGFVDTYSLMKNEYFPYVHGDPIQDGIHPGREAFEIMGDIWYDAVQAIMVHGQIAAKNPTRPGEISHAFNADGTVTISWEPSTDNIAVDHYEVFSEDGRIVSVTRDTSYTTLPLLADSDYTFKVAAVDTSANYSSESVISFRTLPTADTTPPAAPDYVNIYDFTHQALMVEWHAVPDAAEYRVFVDDQVYTTTDTRLTINELQPLTTYTVSVAAVDVAGNESTDNLSAVEMTLPSPVSGFHIASQTNESILLKWTASIEDQVMGYELTFKDGASETLYDVTEYAHEGLTIGQELSYTIAAIDYLGRRSLYSEAIKAVIGTPDKPQNVRETVVTDSSISLEWNAVPSAVEYRVNVSDGDADMTDYVTGPAYTADQLKPATKYAFSIAAINQAGNLSDEARLEVSTQPAKTDDGKGDNGDNGSDSGNGSGAPFIGFAIDLSDKVTYTGEADQVTLTYEPNEQNARNRLNGSDSVYTIEIPYDEPYEHLTLELTGPIIALAAAKNKSIIIDTGYWLLELPPHWLKVTDTDRVKLKVKPAEPSVMQAATQQALHDRSDAYDFVWLLNDQPLERLSGAVRLTLHVDPSTNHDRAGIFHYETSQQQWRYIGGLYHHDDSISTALAHFSVYGVFESDKTFADITQHWARSDIESLAAKQIVSGMTEQLYHPEGHVTRAQFAAMLSRALKLAPKDQSLPFLDVPKDAWYANDIRAAYQNGIIRGMNDDRFAPNERITRQQMAVMIMQAYLYATDSRIEQFEDVDEPDYKDAAQISQWSRNQVRAASSLGLLQGIDGSFRPEQFGSRAQAAAVINRLLKLLI